MFRPYWDSSAECTATPRGPVRIHTANVANMSKLGLIRVSVGVWRSLGFARGSGDDVRRDWLRTVIITHYDLVRVSLPRRLLGFLAVSTFGL